MDRQGKRSHVLCIAWCCVSGAGVSVVRMVESMQKYVCDVCAGVCTCGLRRVRKWAQSTCVFVQDACGMWVCLCVCVF